MSVRIPLLVFIIFCSVGRLFAQEAVVVLRSTVKGNQEQPRVMYIVPWQQPGNSALEYQPLDTLVNELFTTVDRDEFIRELSYREQLKASQSADL